MELAAELPTNPTIDVCVHNTLCTYVTSYISSDCVDHDLVGVYLHSFPVSYFVYRSPILLTSIIASLVFYSYDDVYHIDWGGIVCCHLSRLQLMTTGTYDVMH